MARGVRFTKLEREVIRLGLFAATLGKAAEQRAAESVREKLRLMEAPPPLKEAAGLGFAAAEAAFRAELGVRLVVPPNPPGSWYAIQSRAIKMLGVTAEDCATIAATAALKWTGRIKIESLVRQGAVLLSEAKDGPVASANAPIWEDMEEL